MKVIFLENVEGTAQVGEVKDVKPGFARNYLLPRGLAAPVNAFSPYGVPPQPRRRWEGGNGSRLLQALRGGRNGPKRLLQPALVRRAQLGNRRVDRVRQHEPCASDTPDT